MAGRPPKPLALHRLHGNASHLSKMELSGVNNPEPPVGVPEMPKGHTLLFRRYWRQTVAMLLETPGLLTKIDGPTLEAYCDACDMVDRAEKEIIKYGLLFVTHFETDNGVVTGDIKANPAVTIKAQYQKIKKAMGDTFGLNPSARAKIKLSPKEKADPMADFLSRPRPVIPTKVDPAAMSAGDEELGPN